MKSTHEHLRPLIEHGRQAQELADSKLNVVAEAEQQLASARAEAKSAVLEARQIQEATRQTAFAMASEGNSAVTGEAVADYARVVFGLRGKNPKEADRQASLLGDIASSEVAVPIFLGSRLVVVGGTTGAHISIPGYSQVDGVCLRATGATDVFTQDNRSGQWQWHNSARNCYIPDDGPQTEDMVISDSADEIVSALANDVPIVAVGLEAVLAGIDYKSRLADGGKNAIKFVLAKRLGNTALESSVKKSRLIKDYKATLAEAVAHDQIHPNRPVSTRLHPDIHALVMEDDPAYSQGDEIVVALKDDLDDRGRDSAVRRIYWPGGARRKSVSDVAGRVISAVSDRVETYNTVLNPSSPHIGAYHTMKIAKLVAASEREDWIGKGDTLTRFGREARGLKRVANYTDPAVIMNFMLWHSLARNF